MARARAGKNRRMAILIIFLTGAACYVLMELFWRGHTHWTMALAGGVSAVLLLGIRRAFPTAPLIPLCLLGALVVSAVEFLTGAIVNVWLGWGVWDYSGMKYHLYGQVSFAYTLLWAALCAPAYILLDFVYTLVVS